MEARRPRDRGPDRRSPIRAISRRGRTTRCLRDFGQVCAIFELAARADSRCAQRRPLCRARKPEPRPGVRPGHIPGSLNIPYTELIEADGIFKSRRDAGAACSPEHGVDPARPCVTTCGSGITAAIALLALAQLDAKRAALYDGSWAEWGAHARSAGRGRHDEESGAAARAYGRHVSRAVSRPSALPPPQPKVKLAILRAERPPVHFYRYLYDAVGRDYKWVDRKKLSDAALAEIVQDPRVELYVLYVEGCTGRNGGARFSGRRHRPARLFRSDPRILGRRLGLLLPLSRVAQRLGAADLEAAGQHLHARPSRARCRSISGWASPPIAAKNATSKCPKPWPRTRIVEGHFLRGIGVGMLLPRQR